jgi:hypothetical protein
MSTPSTVPMVETSAAPRRLQSLLIRGGEAPDVHVPLIARGGRGPSPAITEARGAAPKQMGENVTATEALEMADSSRAVPEQGSKRTALEQGMSDCPVKRARVRSKM